MLAKELAEILMKNPEGEVYIIQETQSNADGFEEVLADIFWDEFEPYTPFFIGDSWRINNKKLDWQEYYNTETKPLTIQQIKERERLAEIEKINQKYR